MNIVDAGHQLLKVLARSLLLQPLALNDQFKELAAVREFHNQV